MLQVSVKWFSSVFLDNRGIGLAGSDGRVPVPNNHALTQNLYHNYYNPNPKYLIIGYMDPKP